ncbi:MAG: SCP2 sterol-binding domain-containing protein [Oscillospiraceae bacterium]
MARRKTAAVETTVAEVKENVAAEVKAAPAKAAEKKPAAKKTVKTAEAKPAAKAAKTTKSAAKKPAAKAPRKAKQVTIEDIVAKLYAKTDKEKAAKLEGTIAVDIEVYGAINGHLYLEVKDGAVAVEPYAYEDYTVRAAINADDAVAFVNGKLTLAEAFTKSLYAEGNIGAALKIAAIL